MFPDVSPINLRQNKPMWRVSGSIGIGPSQDIYLLNQRDSFSIHFTNFRVFPQIFPLLKIIHQVPLLIVCFSQRPNYHMTFLLILITFRITTFTHDSASKEESVSILTSTRLLYTLWTSILQTLMSSGLIFLSC